MQEQVDALFAIGAGSDLDLVDQAIEQGAGVLHGAAIAGCDRSHVVDLAAIVRDQGRVRDHWRDLGKGALLHHQRFALGGEFLRAGFELVRIDAGDDRIDDGFLGRVDLCQLLFDLGASGDDAAAFFGPGEAELFEVCGDHVGVEQVEADCLPDPPLQHRVGDRRAVGAGAGLAIRAAAPAIGRDDDHRRAAAPAAQLAREQPCLPLSLGVITAQLIETLLHLRP